MVAKQQIQLRNELYRQLLTTERQDKPDAFLTKVLKLFVGVSRASQGYLEFRDCRGNTIWASQSFNANEITNISNTISTGIIADALKLGKPVKTFSALSDPRYYRRDSVRDAQIKAVLCTPLISDRVRGVLYLQGENGFEVNAKENLRDAGLIADHLAYFAEQLNFCGTSGSDADQTTRLREKYDLAGFVGHSKAIIEVLEAAVAIAPFRVNVLLTGETGTGKTMLAELIHRNSPRYNKTFVAVNCGALPDSLIENELFGAIKGGHSAATGPVKGKVTAALTGTLFLDEIGELSLHAQSRLLHLMESGSYFPLGASQPIQGDVRIITATNTDLRQAVKARKFREDLYYRINTFRIHLPALAERREDIAELALFFVKKLCKQLRLPAVRMSSKALDQIVARPWTGNVRELSNAVETALVRTIFQSGNRIEPRHLLPCEPLCAQSLAQSPTLSANFQEATKQFQQQYLCARLKDRNWNISQTAKAISLSRAQLNNLIKKFRLTRDSAHLPELQEAQEQFTWR